MPGEKIIDLIRAKEARGESYIAFEYFPPKTEQGEENLVKRFERMKQQGPLYADVTWGAGGSTADKTLELCTKMFNIGMETNMHLTCTNMEEEKIDIALKGAKAVGIRNIVALRGDPPVGQEKWEAVEGGFKCALDLVKHIRALYGDYFCLSVAGYPEGHPSVIKPVPEGRKLSESELSRVCDTAEGRHVCFDEDYAKELAYLKSKVDAGADFIITQLFFEVPLFLRYVSDCRAAGIHCPILPGVMLIQNYGGFKRMIGFCRTRVPRDILDAVEAVKDDADRVREVGIKIGTEMCKALMDGGVRGLHLYTLNQEKVCNGVLEGLGMLKPAVE